MIAMVLGLIIIGGVISVFLANKQSYRTNEALSQVQDHGRTAFEFLARDIRMAGLTGCGNTDRLANVLNNGPNDSGGTNEWYLDFANAVRGYESGDPALTEGGGQETDKVNGTDSIQILGAEGTGLSIQGASHKNSNASNSAQFKLNESSSDLSTGDVVVVCDPDHATVLQISKYDDSNVTVVHNTGNKTSPSNCSLGLGFPTVCDGGNKGNPYFFGNNAQVAKLSSADWYIGVNPVGGSSLYKQEIDNQTGTVTTQAVEMVRNVTDMELTYLEAGGTTFRAANVVTSSGDWADVVAVRVELTLQSDDGNVTTDQAALTRSMATTVTIRNRVN
ncbi:MAG: PilW family protein [Halothiobacillaceae bacterium]|nr:PilW family protein [Halothiobacillaceae bacterium]